MAERPELWKDAEKRIDFQMIMMEKRVKANPSDFELLNCIMNIGVTDFGKYLGKRRATTDALITG